MPPQPVLAPAPILIVDDGNPAAMTPNRPYRFRRRIDVETLGDVARRAGEPVWPARAILR